jgi:hypothetical protein
VCRAPPELVVDATDVHLDAVCLSSLSWSWPPGETMGPLYGP